jgi:ankyrin repeat protein
MEHANDRTDRRRRRSPSSALSPSPGPSRPNDQLTLYSDRRSNKRQRRDEDSPDSAAGQLQGYLASDNVAGDYARADYGEAHDLRVTDQHQGHHFEGGQAHGSARVHNGNHYGPVNNYHYPPNGGLTPDAKGNQSKTLSDSDSQNSIAVAMESLSFVRMDNRQANIRKAYATTCRWIFEKPEYKNWRNADSLAEHNGFFWIKSKPGAGKSTLMKFLVQSAVKQLPEDHVVSFFFNARGDLLEKSLEGLYRGLLHQLLTVVPRLQDVLKLQEIASSADQAWPLASLKTLFGEAILKLGQDRVTCFIDALDECPEGEVRDMIEFFEELGESTAAEDIGLRVCFSSRHYPQITMMKCQPMVLDGQDGHEDDIARYVKSKLKVRGKTAEDVRVAVQAKAKGIFMWVVLVIRILNEESDRGSNNAKLRKCLDQIPAELHELFQDILQRGIQDNKHLVPILQWISFAQSPLTREELYFAVQSGDPDFVASQPWDPDEDYAESMDLFILETSKGLAEMTRGKTPTIQFIHESVRDYLRETGFAALAPELSDNLLGLTHDYLKRCCLNFITERVLARLSLPDKLPKAKSDEARSLRKEASELFPFLGYAWKNLIFHAEVACDNGIDQVDFAAALPVTVWRSLSDLFSAHDTRRFNFDPSLARIFVHNGAARLLGIALQEPSHALLANEFNASLQAAIRFKNVHLVTTLISEGACACLAPKEAVNLLIQAFKSEDATIFTALAENYTTTSIRASDLVTVLRETLKDVNRQATIRCSAALGTLVSRHGAQALRRAIDQNMEDVTYLLVDFGVILQDYLELYNEHPIVTASKAGHSLILSLLLTSPTFAIAPSDMVTALSWTCRRGREDVVRTLLVCGAPVNSLDPQDSTPLMEACTRGYLPIVELLIESGADVDFGHGWESPLGVACHSGCVTIAQALLAGGADPNPPDHENPLSLVVYAMASGVTCMERHPNANDEAIVRLLLDNSANPNVTCASRDIDYDWSSTQQRQIHSRTLIYGASIMDNAGLLALLFESGADASIEGGKDYHDALSNSCLNGREEVVKVLLANGTDVFVEDDEYYRGVIEEATRWRHGRIVELVLTEGHGFRAQKRALYSGSLRMALDEGYDEIARILLDMGVELPEQIVTLPPSPSARFY